MVGSVHNPTLQRLIRGNENWIQARSDIKLGEEAKHSVEFVSGQDPDIIIVTCSDSRVIPEFIFDSKIGELFVIRVAGNVITPEVMASVEFAVKELSAKLVMILGHQNCGAVQGKMDYTTEADLSSNMNTLLDRIELSPDDNDIRESVKHNTLYQLEELQENSPLVAESIEKGSISAHAGIYWFETRKVEILSD